MDKANITQLMEKLGPKGGLRNILNEHLGVSWGIDYSNLGVAYGCSLWKDGVPRMGVGPTLQEAFNEACMLWGINVIKLPEEKKDIPTSQKLPPPPPPPKEPKVEYYREGGFKPPSEKKSNPWTDARAEKMREIKSKLRLSDNDQFGIHIETWSKGECQSITDLNDKNVDSFITYMYEKYIDRINKGGLEHPGAGNVDADEEVF